MFKSQHITFMSIGFGLILFFFACGSESQQVGNQTTKNPKAVQEISTPNFNADSAYAFVAKQVDFGPRVPNSTSHVLCGQWLVQTFKSYGAKVITQETIVRAYDGTPLQAKNIIASYKPELANRIILSAHWDTRPIADEDSERQKEPILGANDGGSGVGVLLEMARLFNTQLPSIGVDLILWDAEDYGLPGEANSYCLGSQYWANNKHVANYQARYGINLDMVGAKDAVFLKEGYSMNVASKIVQNIWSTGQRLGYGKYFSTQRTGSITDDHIYMHDPGGVRTVDIIHMTPKGEFFDAWHTHDDTMDVISTETLKAVGQTVAEVVYTEK